ILTALSSDQYNLCIQKYTGQSTGDVANVVAASMAAGDYSGENQFSWTDQYQFAATQQAYQEGGYVIQATTWPPANISTTTQDVFVLNSWSDYSVQHNSADAPPNGFAFNIGSNIALPGASAIIYLNIATGSGSPVTSPCKSPTIPSEDISGSSNQFTPRDQVVVFFNKSATTGSMITESKAYSQIIDLTETHTQTWQLSNQGIWAPATA
ncbi:hypothetical protein H0H93_005861, partial [Arthromyces matolae]